MKIVKIAVSPAMRENIPTRPREGSVQGTSAPGAVAGNSLIEQPQRLEYPFEIRKTLKPATLLVLPVWVLRVLDVPKRPAALHFGNDRKVVRGWWGRC